MVEFKWLPKTPPPLPATTLETKMAARRWLIWQRVPQPHKKGEKPKKDKKVAHYADGAFRGTTDTPEDIARLATYEQARAALKGRDSSWGIGFALGFDPSLNAYWQGYDRDGDLQGLEDWRIGYIEKSPSGQGYHVTSLGADFKTISTKPNEYYSHGRFLTFTGHQVSNNAPVCLLRALPGVLERAEYTPPPSARVIPQETIDPQQKESLRSALGAVDPDDYHNWVRMGLALQSADCGLELWDEMSARSQEGKYDPEITKAKWKSFEGEGRTHWRSIFIWAANDYGWVNRPSPKEPSPYVFYTPNFANPVEDEYVFPGFIGEGITFIIGEPGVGKTSIMTVVAAMIAQAVVPELNPCTWYLPPRRVLFITENVHRVHNITRGLYLQGLLIPEAVRERFLVTDSRRLLADQLAGLISGLVEPHTTYGVSAIDGRPYPVPPLVVIDTARTNVEMNDENENAEYSKIIAALRENVACPIIVLGHPPKSSWGKDASAVISGAGSATGDSDGTLTITRNAELDNEYFISAGGIKPPRVTVPYPVLKVTTANTEEETMTRTGMRTLFYKMPVKFEFMTKEDKETEKQSQDYDKGWAVARDKFKARMEEAKTAEKRGLVFFNPPTKSAKRPADYLHCAWSDIYDDSKRNPHKQKYVREVIRHFGGRVDGDKGQLIIFEAERDFSIGETTPSPKP